jgi:16S rRNA (uracil1498-N3)-methyltransferase
MPLPFFFEENLPASNQFILTEESSKHIVQVLRMKEGDHLLITNGNGYTLTAKIVSAHKKNTEVNILAREFLTSPKSNIAIAISLIKNTNRFEWFIEKATEIGVSTIIPLLCKRTEKAHFRGERIKSILISAMLQSRQVWLPELWEPVKFDELIKGKNYDQKFIAHCLNEKKADLKNSLIENSHSRIILIGPEGDFTEDEIRAAIHHDFIPVSLGENRLRTETAGIIAAVLLK